MITSVKIERLRGIKEGELNNLTPLTVLVGGNGSGKSTVLEALQIGAASTPQIQVWYSVYRRKGVDKGFQWLFWGYNENGEISISIETNKNAQRDIVISCKDRSLKRKENSPDKAHWVKLDIPIIKPDLARHHRDESTILPGVEWISILEPYPGTFPNLAELWSSLKQQGKHQLTNDIIREIIPDFDTLDALYSNGDFVLHNSFRTQGKGSVPVAFSGDGIHALVRFCLELGLSQGGTVLIEEPEVHQHYRTMHLTAKVIWAAIKRDIQVILTTHSLEFIDALLEACPDDADVNALSIVRTNLVEGSLLTRRYSGEETLLARREIQDDLR